MHKCLTVFLLFFILIFPRIKGANLIETLLSRSQAISNEYERVDSLNEWAWNYRNSMSSLAQKLANEGLDLSKSIGYLKGEGDAHCRLGLVYSTQMKTIQALEEYQSAFEIRTAIEDHQGAANILSNMGKLCLQQETWVLGRAYYQKSLNLFLEKGNVFKASQQLHGIGVSFEGEGILDSALIAFQNAFSLAGKDDEISQARYSNSIGSTFYHLGKLDSAQHYLKNSLTGFNKYELEYEFPRVLNNLGLVYLDLGKPRIALDSFFFPARRFSKDLATEFDDLGQLHNISTAYEQLTMVDSALFYLKKYQSTHDELARKGQQFNLLQRQFEIREREAENALLRSETSRKNTLLIAAILIASLILALAGIIWYSGRRRLRTQLELNKKSEALNAQRIVELVQEQELRSLDSLLQGQEIERQRIATDLHDRLGGLMATVKLHFNALERHILPEQQLPFQQADRLIDETCSEIRKISHDLAEGQIAAFGLLNAVRDLADSISGAGDLQVRVFDQHLKERLPLTLERDLYKIIQELLTNVIKHAHATEVTVQLFRHPAHLNLIVEDNGLGIDGIQYKGLGLQSIQGRVQTHKGEFHIDSQSKTGTTILIDIPLNLQDHD